MEHTVVVIGDTDIGRRACAALQDRGVAVTHLASPSDAELHEVLNANITGVAVMLHNDIDALRYSLTIEHIRPGIRLFVAIFDRSVRHEMERLIPNCSVASPAYIAGFSIIASALLQEDAIKRTGPTSDVSWETLSLNGTSADHNGFRVKNSWRWSRLDALIRGQLRPYDYASKVMLTGLFALLLMLISDATILHRDHSWFHAFYSASAVIASVTAPETPTSNLQLLQSAIFMLLTIIFVAIFSAGLVNHLINGRRVGIIGRRVIPRRHHIVIAGLGQVGIRLCKEFKLLKIPVVAIEQDVNARGVALARDLNIPVIIGSASDVRSLKQARVSQSRALLVMASAEEDNVSVAVAARAKFPDARIILRAGTNDAIEETRSLFSIGVVSDVNGLTASFVAQSLLSTEPRAIVPTPDAVAVISQDYQVTYHNNPNRCSCV